MRIALDRTTVAGEAGEYASASSCLCSEWAFYFLKLPELSLISLSMKFMACRIAVFSQIAIPAFSLPSRFADHRQPFGDIVRTTVISAPLYSMGTDLGIRTLHTPYNMVFQGRRRP